MTTLAVALFIAVLIGLGFAWHRSLVRRDTDHTAALAALDADMAAEREEWCTTLGGAIAVAEDARGDAEWARVVLAFAQHELDWHAQHTTLLGLDGIRADRAAGVVYAGDEPPLSVAVREGAQVVDIKAKR